MDSPFVDPGELNSSQLIFLTLVYATVLYQASNLISGGSELLMLLPSVAALVGSVVLPILGAVPDGMMVLFSGVGPNAQETVAVGVGALAGSTVMLLTFPWFICITYGRVPIKDGSPDFAGKGPVGCCSGAISYLEAIPANCKIMLLTTCLYLIIQVPASHLEMSGATTKEQSEGEHIFALVGVVACIAAFLGYLAYCVWDATEDKQLAAVIKGIDEKQIVLAAALDFILKSSGGEKEQSLMQKKQKDRLRAICKPFFRKYDKNNDKTLTLDEVPPLMLDLGLQSDPRKVRVEFEKQDVDKDGKVSFAEFSEYLFNIMQDPIKMATLKSSVPKMKEVDAKAEDGEEEEEMPEDIASLPVSEQRCRILLRSFWMMGLGTALVLLFSDPMVDCLSEWGKRLDVSPFYISFVLAPFASNASELLSAYTYACKKTEKNITTSLSTLVGAACMNNTFVLGIFLALVYLQGLAWQFTAETIAMVLIQWVIGIVAMMSKKQTMFHAVLILLCYPGCLFIVWILENKVGLD